jgi:uncharacterized protein YhaN
MKIGGWSIDGFGLFRDYAIENLPDGLVVFHGPNEAGKTTLLAFLRGVLFGFGAGSLDSGLRYPPLRGGRQGGRVILHAPDGSYSIERHADNGMAAHVARLDGEPAGGEALRRVLGGVDDALFRAVFAFSLAELQALESLDVETVRERVFSAAVAGAARSARAVLRDLDERGATLFDEREDARINALVASLNELRPRRDAARRAALGYAEAAAAERRAEVEIESLAKRAEAERAAKRRAELLLDLAPTWEDLAAARRDLAALSAVDDPEEPRARLVGLAARRAAAGAGLAELEREQAEAEREQQQIRALLPRDSSGRLERLYQDAALQRARLARLPQLEQRLSEGRRSIDLQLGALGLGWQESRLLAIDSSAATRSVAQGWAERFTEASADAQLAQQAMELESARCDALAREHAAARARAAEATTPDAARLGEQREALRRLRIGVEEASSEQARGEAADRTARDRERTLLALQAEISSALPAWLPAGLWAVLLAAAAGMVWRGLEADLAGVASLALAGVAAALAAIAAGRARRAAEGRERQREAAMRARRSELNESRRQRDAHWRRGAEITESIGRDAVKLGLPRLPSFDLLEERERELAREEAELSRSEALRAEASAIGEALARAERERAERTAALDRARARIASLEQEWVLWKRERDLPGHLTPGGVLDLLVAVQQMQAEACSLDGVRDELAELKRAADGWEREACALLTEAGIAGAPDLDAVALIEQLLALRQRREASEGDRLKLARLESEAGARSRKIAAAKAEIERCDAERRTVLAGAGVADEGELEQRREMHRRRADLERQVAEGERHLERLLGEPGRASELRAALAAGDRARWSGQLAEVDETIGRLEAELLEAAARRREIGLRCRALEQSSEVAELEGEWNALMAELEDAVREWRVLALARGLVAETLVEFERSRQPEVLAEASRIFEVVTGGRYQRVLQDESGSSLLIEDAGGQRKRVAGELSRGTAEQLYLSLRLGLAADFARRGTSLPLVMDDVLVNFDPERARGMAAALREFARHHQVLFFTCHPDTCALLRDEGGADAVIEIGGGPA